MTQSSKKKVNEIELLVIGAGPGGYPAAFLAADMGMKVTLVDPRPNPGGVCLFCGCIPSKALLHAMNLIHAGREAAGWGIEFGEPKIDLDKLRARKQQVVDRLTGGLGQLGKQRKINYVRGKAELKNGASALIRTQAGDEREVHFDYAIVATGSQPVTLPFAPDSDRILDSEQALNLPDTPEKLLLIGGGYIGLELGQVYAALGAGVSVVEMMPSLLPGADADLVKGLTGRLKQQFAATMLETKVTQMEAVEDGIKVTFEGKNAPEQPTVYSRVLMAIGRRPDASGCGLENTAARIDDRGFVEVDARRRTAEETIFAIGDITGQPMLAHKATYEGKVAVEAIAGRKTIYDPRAIPAVMFTDPEIAWCGLTETEAARQERRVKITRFPWAASGRATTLGRKDGLTKLVLDPETDRVLGVGIAGPGAGELIAEGVLAVEMGAVAEDLALTIHAHPTLSETVMEAAEAAAGKSTHYLGRG